MDEVFVTQDSPNEVSAISDASNSVVSNIPMTGSLVFSGLAYDSGKNLICVLGSVNSAQPSPVTVVSDKNNSIVGNFNGGDNPYALAYDFGKDEMFVANLVIPGNVAVIPDSAIPSGSSSLFSGTNFTLVLVAGASLVVVAVAVLFYLRRKPLETANKNSNEGRSLTRGEEANWTSKRGHIN